MMHWVETHLRLVIAVTGVIDLACLLIVARSIWNLWQIEKFWRDYYRDFPKV